MRYEGSESGLSMVAFSSVSPPPLRKTNRYRVDASKLPGGSEMACIEKPKFVTAVSHDLRQLLFAMNFFNESLSQQLKDPNCLKIAHNMENTIASMQAMIDSMLNVLRYDAVNLSPNISRFNLKTVLDRLSSEFSPQAQAKGVAWSCDGGHAIVQSDEMLVEVALRNLIANALKYTDRGAIWVTCTPHHPNQLAIAVGDTGVGIPPDQLPLIFQEFYRLKPGVPSCPGGLGLGLSIVEKICKILGGHVTIESTLGSGSIFTLFVPLTKRKLAPLEKITTPSSLEFDRSRRRAG